MAGQVARLTLFVIIVWSARVDAGAWYYRWSCAGECAPGRLAISGVSAGYPTQEMCETDRWNDPRREQFLAPGNLGGLTSCEEYDSAPPASDIAGTSSGRAIPFQRFSLGVSAGKGWQVRDATTLASDGTTLGLDANYVIGARPWIGLELGIGLQFSSVQAPHYGADAKTLTFIPVTLGVTSSPRIVHATKLDVRLDLAADLVLLYRYGCDECDAESTSTGAFGWQFRAGLDTYFGRLKNVGIGVAATLMLTQLGDLMDPYTPSAVELTPPKFLLRVALLGRNSDLAW